MANEVQKLSGEYQRTGKEAFSSILRSAGDYRRSLQEVSFEWAEFSKKSINQAIEAQAQLTKKAFAAYISELQSLQCWAYTAHLPATDCQTGGVPKKHEAADQRTAQEKPARDEIVAITQRKALGARANGLPLNARARIEKQAQPILGK